MTEAELEFREFFAAAYGRLRGLGYLLTSDWAEAEELAQDAPGPHLPGLVAGPPASGPPAGGPGAALPRGPARGR